MAEETTTVYAKVSPEGQVIQVSESDVQPQLTQAEQAQGYSVQEVPQGTKAGDVVEVEEKKQRQGGGPAFSGQESLQERQSRNLQGSQGPEVLRPDKQQPEPQPTGQAKSGQSQSKNEDEKKTREREQQEREKQEREKKEREQKEREQREREQAKTKQR